MEFIPFALPDLAEDEINEVVDSLKSGWVTTGPKTAQFEKNFSQFIGCKYSLGVNSATAGLHLSLDAIGLKRGDKVIVPVYTFTSTAEVVRYFDADPIFCDVDSNTLNIDINKLEQLLKKHSVKAIMPVHFAGQSCEMEAIMSLAKKYNCKVIEDAAHAFPTTYKDKMIGTVGDITVFSFYATKTLCTGEGGMVCTNNDDYAKRIKVMRLHGFDRDAWNRYSDNKASWFYSIVAPGYKYNLTDIASSMGIHQLKKATQFYERRNEIAHFYDQSFEENTNITPLLNKDPQNQHAYHLYVIKTPNRDSFIEKMKEANIGCSVHFIPLHLQPYWKEKYKLESKDFINAYNAFQEVVSLPLYTKLTQNQVEYIAQKANEFSNG